jgi:hypothetical protein
MLSRARALWRAARTWPLVRSLVAATDRAWWVRVILRADIVDLEFVAASWGRPLTPRAAVRAYVRGGFHKGFSLNPLFVESMVSRQLSDSGRVPALYAYLVNDRSRIAVSPHWDALAYGEEHPAALSDPAGPLGHAWRAARDGQPLLLGPADRRVPTSWQEFGGLASRIAAAARDAQATLDHRSAHTLAGDTTIVSVLDDREPDLDRVIALLGGVAIALNASVQVGARLLDTDGWVQLALSTLWIPDARIRRAPLAPAALLARFESEVEAGVVVALGPGAQMSPGDMIALAEAGRSRPTAPLWLAPDGTVAAAGAISVGARRCYLLAGHPAEDARALGAELDVVETAGLTRAFAVGSDQPARTLLTTTVTAPAHALFEGPVSYPDSDLDALLAPAGLRLAEWRGPESTRTPHLARIPAEEFGLDDGTLVPRLRWALKTASPAGAAGESWGDTHFARGLGAALRRLGQEVVIDAFPARTRPSGYLDDVALVLRGPERIEAPRESTSLLWIISHPDEITAEELEGFDAVFAASTLWADGASRRFGRTILPLLQCTDTTRFHPTGQPRTDEIVFVGTARGIARPSVVEPVAAGVPVSVYGPDWRGYIPAERITATGIANDDLPALYERAAVVLNDHWPAMRREGFISNRPYDVVASGGRVISDDVEGIAAEFEGAVAVYRDIPHLLGMLRGDLDREFPDEAELARISQRVRDLHSFDARARTLLHAAVAARTAG